jgi:hypothetical protein
MFLNELKPIVKELAKEPVAFCSGFVTGLLRLNLNDDPVKTWLAKQGVTASPNDSQTTDKSPQSIEIE